jgi:cyclohexa-1,5-dienecarbonyl-CoA hydratase
MSESPVRIEQSEGGALLRLVLDRPKGNVLDSAMLSALQLALEEHVGPATRAVAFEGAGAHFSFGASVSEHQAAQAPAMLAQFHGLFRQLAKLCVPTCALVRGQCLGGGLELAAWCTWIFADGTARFGQPEITLAVFPPMASLLLPWRLGGGAALDLCLSGRSVDAAEAHRLGLVTAVVDDPLAHWDAFARETLLPKSAVALRLAERATRLGLLDALEARLGRLEALYLYELMRTRDANEGIAAFLERRPPVFQHR